MKKCKMTKDHEVQKCNDNEHEIFSVVEGQCHSAMKNKVESVETHDDSELNGDVKGVLESIESVCCANEETKCEFDQCV